MHQKFPHPSWIEIDLGQFKKNVAAVKGFIGDLLYCLPIKANAYGHGLRAVGLAAEEAGVDYLAVAHLQEGIELRQANVRIPILVLGAIHEDQVLDLINFNLEFTISSKFKADVVAQKSKKLKQKCRVHLEVDTGMQRTGVRSSSFLSLYQHLKELKCFDVVGVYSHLATADRSNDPFAQKQIESFHNLFQDPCFAGVPIIRHLANSGGVLYYPNSHLDMVRPSLLTFGFVPPDAPEALKTIAPCFCLKSKVSYFKVVEKGEGVSYGHSYVTKEQSRIVTVPVGYGDGYRRELSNLGSVLIRGKKYPIVGTICMDQFMVNVSKDEVYVGDEVVLIGRQGLSEISIQEMADLSRTISHEVLCFFNDRVPRIYLN